MKRKHSMKKKTARTSAGRRHLKTSPSRSRQSRAVVEEPIGPSEGRGRVSARSEEEESEAPGW